VTCDCATCTDLRAELPELIAREAECVEHFDDPDDRAYAARDEIVGVREQIHLVEAQLRGHDEALERHESYARRRCASCLRDDCTGDVDVCSVAAADRAEWEMTG
jgi:hypothetical protein